MEKVWYGESFKLGVLGAGQLGRMLIQSAISYDVQVYCMDANESFPCSKIANEFIVGDITNYEDVMAFGADKNVLTVEIEHVNVEALEALEKKGVKVFPQPRILRIIQDKGAQKEFYLKNDIPTAPFKLIRTKEDLFNQAEFLPFVQKMRTGGYDGKGVYVVPNEAALEGGFDVPSVLEQFVDFEKELSVIVARNENGEIKTFPLVECEFNPKLNLVEFLFSPAAVSQEVEQAAEKIAHKIVEKLDFVGLLAVELFLTKEAELLVNEIAPRTHNSGHHTIEGNFTSQFEQHLRAILNLPLGATDLRSPAVMVNLLGDENYSGPTVYEGITEVMRHNGVYVHVYGKSTTKPFRKMGHITVVNEDLEKAKDLARVAKSKLIIKSRS